MKVVFPRVIRGNRGDLLSRWGILASLNKLGLTNPTIFCDHKKHIPFEITRTYFYGPLYNLWPGLAGFVELCKSDIVLWTGGLDLQDDSSLIKLMHLLIQFCFYRLLGLKIVFVMQGAGPLNSSLGRFLARCILKKSILFIGRDHRTCQLIKSLNTHVPILQSGDGIFLDGFEAPLTACEQKKIDSLLFNKLNCPVIGINIRLWFHFASNLIPYQFAKQKYRNRAQDKMSHFIKQISEYINHIRKTSNAKIVLFSMYEPGVEPWEDDLPYLNQIKSQYFKQDSNVCICEEDLSIPAFYRLLSGFNLVLSTRLHGALTALRSGVPAIHIYYTNKGRDIYENMGLSECAFSIEAFMNNPNIIFPQSKAILEDNKIKLAINNKVQHAIDKNKQLLSDVYQFLLDNGKNTLCVE